MNTIIDPRFPQRPECYETGTSDRSFIEFQRKPGSCQGFAMGQLLHYTLEPEDGGAPDAPSERLTLAFSTADVVVLGARLVQLTKTIAEHKLAVVRPVSGRYSRLNPEHPWVAEILIRPLKSGGAAG
jgi:hypothetical protein